MSLPGAGEDDVTSSSSSRARFLRPGLLGPLFAADILGRKGELEFVVRGKVEGAFWCKRVPHIVVRTQKNFAQASFEFPFSKQRAH